VRPGKLSAALSIAGGLRPPPSAFLAALAARLRRASRASRTRSTRQSRQSVRKMESRDFARAMPIPSLAIGEEFAEEASVLFPVPSFQKGLKADDEFRLSRDLSPNRHDLVEAER
jgi:hypothetical protein